MFLFMKAAQPLGVCGCLVDESTAREHKQYLYCHLSMKMGQIKAASHSSLTEEGLVTEHRLRWCHSRLSVSVSLREKLQVRPRVTPQVVTHVSNLACDSKSLDEWSKRPLSVNGKAFLFIFWAFSYCFTVAQGKHTNTLAVWRWLSSKCFFLVNLLEKCHPRKKTTDVGPDKVRLLCFKN